MHIVTIDGMKDLVRHIAVRHDHPLMIWGGFGIGKSEGVAQIARDLDAVLCDVRLSQYDSVDLRGVPLADRETQSTRWLQPEALPFVGNDLFPDDKIIVLFLDEMTSATISVQAAAYQLVNDRKVGEHMLKPNVRIVAASNRDGDRGVVNRQPLPLANRFVHCEMVPDVTAWIKHALDVGLPPIAAGFYQFRKDLLFTYDPSKPNPDKAIATPRTSEKAWRYYADPDLPIATKRAAMAGAVGQGVATEIWAFVDVWQDVIKLLPQILKNPQDAPIPKEPAMMWALATYLAGEMTAKTVKAINAYGARLEQDHYVLMWTLAVRRDKALYATKEFIEYSKSAVTLFS